LNLASLCLFASLRQIAFYLSDCHRSSFGLLNSLVGQRC